jgi:hypothetical protein
MARRACSDKYNMRLYKDGKIGKYIWTEFRCPNVVSGDAKICVGCSNKLPKYKYQSSQKCDHGLIGGPYPVDSKLYGSLFYLREVKDGFALLDADELRAKEAVATAVSKMPKKKIVATVVEVAQVAEVAVAPAPPAPIPKPKKTPIKVKVKPTNTVTVSAPVIPLSDTSATMLESMALPPITVSEVIIVKVRKVRHKGKDYYFDSNSGKLYNALAKDAGVGAYAGRYNPESDILDNEYPDSDVEE